MWRDERFVKVLVLLAARRIAATAAVAAAFEALAALATAGETAAEAAGYTIYY